MASSPRAVGEVRDVRGRLVEVLLGAGSSVAVGQRLEVGGRDAPLGVLARCSERELRCATIAGPVTIGETVFDAGRAWTQELDASAMVELAEALTPRSAAYREVLETGIKAIDFLSPLRSGGSLVVLGGPRTAKTVLPNELATLLGAKAAQQIHVPMCKPLPQPLTELRKGLVAEGMPAWDRIGEVELVWSPFSAAADPTYATTSARTSFDAVVYLSSAHAIRGLYPAVDPTQSGSKPLREHWVEREHIDTHAQYLRAVSRVRELTADAWFWELLAQGATAAASARFAEVDRSVLTRASRDDSTLLRRVRKAERYLTQPFTCAQPFTGIPGSHVPRLDTIRTVAAILRGAFDAVDDRDLYLKGKVTIPQ